MSILEAKLPEVKTVYERNKRSNNIYYILRLLSQNIKDKGTLEKFRPKKSTTMFNPIHSENICLLPQKQLVHYKKMVEDKRGKIVSLANKSVTLTGACQSMTLFQTQK